MNDHKSIPNSSSKRLYLKIIIFILSFILILHILLKIKDNVEIKQLDAVEEFNLCLDSCGHWKNSRFTNLSAHGMGTCSANANKRGFNQSIITFSFYGDLEGGREYFKGIEENIKLLSKFYPGWVMRVYHNIIEPNSVRKICEVYCLHKKVLDICYAGEIPGFGNLLDYNKPMWRFLGLADSQVDYMMIRDLDSRFSEREAAAVREWLQSGAALHVMRDHPDHLMPILSGMWGVKVNGHRDIWRPSFDKILQALYNRSTYNDDQVVLKPVFKLAGSIPGFMIQHDSYYCRKEEYFKGEIRPFPTKRLSGGRNFVGAAIPTQTIGLECPLPCRKQPNWTVC